MKCVPSRSHFVSSISVKMLHAADAVLHEIEEKAHDFSRGMNPTTHDTISPR